MAEAVSERYKEALRLGHVAVAKGRPREAVAHYEQAGRLAGARPLPFISMGSVLLRMRQPAEAIAAYDEALRRAPDDIEALRGKARALEAAGETAEATRLLARADAIERPAASSPEPRPAPPPLTGPEQHAAVALQAAAAGDRPIAIMAWLNAARAYDAAGASAAALDAALRAVEIDPGAIGTHLAMADMYLRRGWNELAVERILLIERRLAIEPEPGAAGALGQLAGRHRDVDPELDRIATAHA